MAGALKGIRVLDLTWGIAGPMTTMVLADNGSDVVKIEPPGGDVFRSQRGYKVWQSGKKSAFFDLKSVIDREQVLTLVAKADVLVESGDPGSTSHRRRVHQGDSFRAGLHRRSDEDHGTAIRHRLPGDAAYAAATGARCRECAETGLGQQDRTRRQQVVAVNQGPSRR